MRSTCPGQQLILAHQHEPGPIGLEQQLGRVHHLLEGLGEILVDVKGGQVPMLVTRAAGSIRIALVLPAWMIPSHEGPRLAGSEGPGPRPPASGKRNPRSA
jgi:hypothetical protein